MTLTQAAGVVLVIILTVIAYLAAKGFFDEIERRLNR
jgi:hypothetical protein